MDINKIVSGLASSGVMGGLAGGAVGGALMSNKTMRKGAGTLLKVGGMAALGTMAWKAYQGYQEKQVAPAEAATGAPAGGAGTPGKDQAWGGLSQQQFALQPTAYDAAGSPSVLLLQSMIAAACADGQLDSAERARIMSRLEQLELKPDENAMIFDALQNPPSLTIICEQVDSPELATEVYLSSLLAIDRTRTESRLYLDALAFRLGMPQGLVQQLEYEVKTQETQIAA